MSVFNFKSRLRAKFEKTLSKTFSQSGSKVSTDVTSTKPSALTSSRPGFTIIEVMLFLGLSGMILVGVIAGTYTAIGVQRYNDSVRSFAEFLRQTYAEVISPETLGTGASNDYAIYGKILVFGVENATNNEDRVYSATLIGSPNIPTGSNTFVEELKSVSARLFCGSSDGKFDSTVDYYAPLWESKILNTDKQQFTGTVIIARSPTSGTVHTAYSTEQFNLKENCEPNNTSASTQFYTVIDEHPESFSTRNDINFCLRSEHSNIIRDIRISSDGRNTSAINILTDDDPEGKCH